MSVVLRIVAEKVLEVLKTPGVGNKLAALFIGKHSASSIAGIVGALCILAAGSVAEHLGVAVDRQLVVGVAVTVLLGGRSARPRKKRSPAAAQGVTSGSVTPESVRTSPKTAAGDLSKAETRRIEVVEAANESGQPNFTKGQ